MQLTTRTVHSIAAIGSLLALILAGLSSAAANYLGPTGVVSLEALDAHRDRFTPYTNGALLCTVALFIVSTLTDRADGWKLRAAALVPMWSALVALYVLFPTTVLAEIPAHPLGLALIIVAAFGFLAGSYLVGKHLLQAHAAR